MKTDMCGTQGQPVRCPREERLSCAEFWSREPRHGNRGNKNDGNSCRDCFEGGAIPSLDRFQAQAIWEMSVEASTGFAKPRLILGTMGIIVKV